MNERAIGECVTQFIPWVSTISDTTLQLPRSRAITAAREFAGVRTVIQTVRVPQTSRDTSHTYNPHFQSARPELSPAFKQYYRLGSDDPFVNLTLVACPPAPPSHDQPGPPPCCSVCAPGKSNLPNLDGMGGGCTQSVAKLTSSPVFHLPASPLFLSHL